MSLASVAPGIADRAWLWCWSSLPHARYLGEVGIETEIASRDTISRFFSMTTEFKQMRTWLPPLVLFLVLVIVVAGIWTSGGYDVIDKYHVVAASLLGLVVGLPLLLWRTLVASNQLKTSLRIWTDGIFANGANMLGEKAPETRWAGINTLIGLVEEHSEYMVSVVLSFCAFLRPVQEPGGGIIQKPNEQNVRISEAMNRWLKSDAWARDTRLDLRGVSVSEIRLDSIRLNLDMTDEHIERSCINDVDFSGSNFSRRRRQFIWALTSLKDCKFDRANLTGAIFEGVDLTGCTFDDADISSMILSNQRDSPKTKVVVTRAQLQKAHWKTRPVIAPDVVDADTGEPLTL